MQPVRTPIATVLALVLALAVVLAVSGCGGAAPATVGGASAAPSASAASPSVLRTGSAVSEACALVPHAELEAAMGADPGEGEASKGKIGGGQCTWKVSDTHTALAQWTPEPDVYLPDGVWERPKSGADVPGATRGFAAAETHTILIVKGGHGLLFTDVAFSKADQPAYDALAEAIAARM